MSTKCIPCKVQYLLYCRAKYLLYACLGCSACCIHCLQSIMPAVYAPCRTQRLLYAFFAKHNAWYIHSLQGTVPSVYLPAGHTACCMHTLHSAVNWGLGHKAHGGGAGDEIVHLVALLAKPDFFLMPPRPQAPAQHTVAALQRVPALTIPLSPAILSRALFPQAEPCQGHCLH